MRFGRWMVATLFVTVTTTPVSADIPILSIYQGNFVLLETNPIGKQVDDVMIYLKDRFAAECYKPSLDKAECSFVGGNMVYLRNDNKKVVQSIYLMPKFFSDRDYAIRALRETVDTYSNRLGIKFSCEAGDGSYYYCFSYGKQNLLRFTVDRTPPPSYSGRLMLEIRSYSPKAYIFPSPIPTPAATPSPSLGRQIPEEMISFLWEHPETVTKEMASKYDCSSLWKLRLGYLARRGAKFNDAEVQSYFQTKDWYQPKSGEPALTDDERKAIGELEAVEYAKACRSMGAPVWNKDSGI